LPTYRLHDTIGEDLGTIERPSTTLGPGDVVELEDGRPPVRRARITKYERAAMRGSSAT
jgi:hypothetical protein